MRARALSHLPFLLAAILASTQLAGAQAYPSRPITMIVPFSAGGPTDTLARIMAEAMRKSLGQVIVIENVTGASGSIGTGRSVRATPDGYTLGVGTWPTHVVNGAVLPLPYDLLTDLEPVALFASNPLLIVAKKTMPANDLKELISWLKANPGKASQGTSGPGSASHIAGLFFQKQTGTDFEYVPYRGGLGPAMQDLVAGQIDMIFDLAANSLPQIRAGTIKVYAATAKSRLTSAPDIPTVDEAGLPGLYVAPFHAIFVPKGTPRDIIARLNAAIMTALEDPAVRQRLTELGQEIPPREQQTPEALGAYHKAEVEKWWPLIKGAGIKPQ
jgi:tripartite-type tricarboxylate transporter receptor subunit TctC